MLVLTRKINEELKIGPDVTVRVVKVAGNTVRLGISAPKDTIILRGELEPHENQEEAAGQ